MSPTLRLSGDGEGDPEFVREKSYDPPPKPVIQDVSERERKSLNEIHKIHTPSPNPATSILFPTELREKAISILRNSRDPNKILARFRHHFHTFLSGKSTPPPHTESALPPLPASSTLKSQTEQKPRPQERINPVVQEDTRVVEFLQDQEGIDLQGDDLETLGIEEIIGLKEEAHQTGLKTNVQIGGDAETTGPTAPWKVFLFTHLASQGGIRRSSILILPPPPCRRDLEGDRGPRIVDRGKQIEETNHIFEPKQHHHLAMESTEENREIDWNKIKVQHAAHTFGTVFDGSDDMKTFMGIRLGALDDATAMVRLMDGDDKANTCKARVHATVYLAVDIVQALKTKNFFVQPFCKERICAAIRGHAGDLPMQVALRVSDRSSPMGTPTMQDCLRIDSSFMWDLSEGAASSCTSVSMRKKNKVMGKHPTTVNMVLMDCPKNGSTQSIKRDNTSEIGDTYDGVDRENNTGNAIVDADLSDRVLALQTGWRRNKGSASREHEERAIYAVKQPLSVQPAYGMPTEQQQFFIEPRLPCINHSSLLYMPQPQNISEMTLPLRGLNLTVYSSDSDTGMSEVNPARGKHFVRKKNDNLARKKGRTLVVLEISSRDVVQKKEVTVRCANNIVMGTGHVAPMEGMEVSEATSHGAEQGKLEMQGIGIDSVTREKNQAAQDVGGHEREGGENEEATSPGAAGQLTGVEERACQKP